MLGEMSLYKIHFYADKKGNEPVREYIEKLKEKAATDKKARVKLKKIVEFFGILERNGTRAGSHFVKHIENGIWELRPIDNRIFFFYWRDNTFILLHHFQKKSKKTPKREIEQAKRNKRDFIERSEA